MYLFFKTAAGREQRLTVEAEHCIGSKRFAKRFHVVNGLLKSGLDGDIAELLEACCNRLPSCLEEEGTYI